MHDTLHWNGVPTGDSNLDDLRRRMSQGPNEEAFLGLLRSEKRAPACVALEYFHTAQADRRHGRENPYALHGEEVRKRALKLLKSPPTPKTVTGSEYDGADHASALLALASVGRAEDAPWISYALELSPEEAVTGAALEAANRVFMRTDGPLNKRLLGAVSRVVLDPSNDPRDRLDALNALNNVSGPEAAELAMRAMADDDPHLQVNAADIIATRHLATHRAELEALVETWPENMPYPAAEVIDILEQGPMSERD